MIILSRVDLSLPASKGKKIFTANLGRILFMKKLIEKRNIIEPIQVTGDVALALDETIHDKVSWTAALPQGELAKLKKVCKPVAASNGITFWVLDESKTKLILK